MKILIEEPGQEPRDSRNLPHTSIQTDSHVAVQLLELLGALTPDSLKEMAEAVEGSFVFTLMDQQDRLYLVKGDNPMPSATIPG